jgi:colanic acid/amylovoran biosynthesis glycosyltransferase
MQFRARMNTYHVVHVKQNMYLSPTETFVHARVLNPICARPVPVMTDQVRNPYDQAKEITFYELATLHSFLQRTVQAVDYRLHWNAYYFEILRHLRPQLIHAHFSGAGEECLWSAKVLKLPLLVNFYGVETNYHIHEAGWSARYQRIYEGADALICSSDHMKVEMVKSGCPQEKINVVRCGIDTDFFTGDVTEWRPRDTLRLLSIARLHPEKGLSNLLRACLLLNQNGFNRWKLEIIGLGPAELQLKQMANSLGLEKQVEFLGHKTPADVREKLRIAHIMILPSLKETQGVVLQEAQATCTPIIASDVGGIPEGVLDGTTGILVHSNSPVAIAVAIETFIKNPLLLIKMGNAGRRFVEKKFSRKVEYEELSSIYYSLLSSS